LGLLNSEEARASGKLLNIFITNGVRAISRKPTATEIIKRNTTTKGFKIFIIFDPLNLKFKYKAVNARLTNIKENFIDFWKLKSSTYKNPSKKVNKINSENVDRLRKNAL
jgi:hypothetical protein